MKYKVNPRKAELIALSATIKVMKALGQVATINEGLISLYMSRTGGKVFKGFYDWKQAGYKVKKGEQGFPIWSRPKAMKFKRVADDGQESEEERNKFAVAYLWNEMQVERI